MRNACRRNPGGRRLNAGYYEQATGAEIRGHVNGRQVLEEVLLPSGQVRFLGGQEHVGRDDNGHWLVSSSGEEAEVCAGKVVDATYLDTELPATHPPRFEIDLRAHVVTPTELVEWYRMASSWTTSPSR